MSATREPTAGWLAPRSEEPPLGRYLTALREHAVLALAVFGATVVAALVYLALAPRSYEAQAQILVTPIDNDADKTFGLSLIRASVDPSRDVSTASEFVKSREVARGVARRHVVPGSTQTLAASVVVQPVAQSSVVAITASASDPRRAAKIANSFADETVRVRTWQLHQQIDSLIPPLQRRVASLNKNDLALTDLPARLSALEVLRGAPDPTLRVSSRADPPTAAASPKPRLTVLASLLLGLLLGSGAALASQSLDPRLRREEQLREMFRLPILARIPKESKSAKRGPIAPNSLSGVTVESYRTLRATFLASRIAGGGSRSIMITGAAPAEGKSTSALNFSYALSQAGSRVLLIELDLYRPSLGIATNVRPAHGVASVLVRERSVTEAAVETRRFGPNLHFLLAEGAGASFADRLALPTAAELIPQAEAHYDYVVLDAPPLTDVSDVLPLAKQASDVVVVTRLKKSRLPRLRRLGELLSQNGITPAGVVVVGIETGESYYSYYTRAPSHEESRREHENARIV